MNDDDFFRAALLIVGAIFMPLGLYYRIRSYTGEKLDRWQEGAFILFGLRLSALAMFAGGVAWMIHPPWMAGAALPLPFWPRCVALGVAVCAGALWVWAVHTLGKNLTDTVVTRQQHTLVVGGPYRWVRHPFYTATLVGILAGSLAMANWFFLALGGLGAGFLIARTRTEEHKLIDRFGDAYRQLMQRMGRYWPKVRRGP